jgi:regulator of sigma E protease
MLYRMVTGVASLQNLSGPITIASFANTSAQLGVAWFLFFLAVLSLSLCIMNLLPIPILDGGHLLYYLIELIKGSPVSERALAAGQYVGLAMLAGLMGLAFYNDILRLVT